jgi:hypothetical protein
MDTQRMTKRLQVLLEDDELVDIQRAARQRRQSVAEWVRAALRKARAAEGGPSAADKLRAVRESTGHAFPTGSIDAMLEEIGRGYRGAS